MPEQDLYADDEQDDRGDVAERRTLGQAGGRWGGWLRRALGERREAGVLTMARDGTLTREQRLAQERG